MRAYQKAKYPFITLTIFILISQQCIRPQLNPVQPDCIDTFFHTANNTTTNNKNYMHLEHYSKRTWHAIMPNAIVLALQIDRANTAPFIPTCKST